MGKVLVTAKIENMQDIHAVQLGLLRPDQIRSIEVHDALVDTGATMFSMPKRLIAQLGLEPVRIRQARTAGGLIAMQIYGLTRVTVQGRECFPEVAELPDECPVLIGQVPLEVLDFVVDLQGQRLVGNPEHGGEQMIDVF
jgi:predicted aspartyl protease